MDRKQIKDHFKHIATPDLKSVLEAVENIQALDTVDWYAMDPQNDLSGLLQALKDEYGITINITPEKERIEAALRANIDAAVAEERRRMDELNEALNWEKVIPELRTVFVTADLGQGKTAFSYYLLDILKEKMPVFVYKHPKPRLVEERGYQNMYCIDEIDGLRHAAVWIDEPQIVFPKYENSGSRILNKILSLARQRDIVLILSTSDTRYITAAEEFYISTFIIKKIDYAMIKRGSKIKQILEGMDSITVQGYCDQIKKDEFLLYNKNLKNLNAKYKFILPQYFTEQHSKPFAR